MRRYVFAVVVGMVGLLHVEVLREVALRLPPLDASDVLPTRIEVAYVRTLEPSLPATYAPPAAPAAPTRPKPRVHRALAAALPASEAALSEPVGAAEPIVTAEEAASAAKAATAAIAAASATTAPIDGERDVAPPVLAAAPASAPPAEVAAASAPSFVWPASTRVRYELTGYFRGDVKGHAQVEWVHVGDRYQVHMDLVVGPEFAPLITRRMTSDGGIAASGLVPDRYDQETQVVFRERHLATVRFEPDAVVLADGERRARPIGVQDTASQFVQLTYRFSTEPGLLRVGNTIDVPLALPRATDRWRYDVVAEETLATPFGPIDAFHLKPQARVRQPGELSAEIWFAPSLRYLPVRIRIEQDAATFIDCTIAQKPELAAS